MVPANLSKLIAAALPHTPPATWRDHALTVLLQETDGGRHTPDPSVVALLDNLRTDADLGLFQRRMQVVGGTVAHTVTHVFLAEWLLRRARAVGPDQAVKDLARYLATDRLPYCATIAVGGLTPDRAYDLGHGMRLLPWKDITPSRTKMAIEEAPTFHRSFYHPDGALVREIELPRAHVDLSETRKHFRDIDWSDMTDLLLCLGLFGPNAPVLIASWLEAPEWAPVMAGTYSMPFVEGPGRARPFGETDATEAVRLYSAWLGLADDRRAAFRVPMERLNSAMRRSSPVDSAIDLGIVLESLFLRDGQGELTFRLRVRAARWLGSTPEERKRLSATVGDLYKVRSKAVHEGRVPDTIHQRTTTELLDETYELTARALVALISKGDPDWDAVTYS